jgi:hypothetical protein
MSLDEGAGGGRYHSDERKPHVTMKQQLPSKYFTIQANNDARNATRRHFQRALTIIPGDCFAFQLPRIFFISSTTAPD